MENVIMYPLETSSSLMKHGYISLNEDLTVKRAIDHLRDNI